MPDLYQPQKFSVAKLLEVGGQPIVVPEWQRNYSWAEEQVEELWNDILGFHQEFPGKLMEAQEYFLGSIVLVNEGPRYLLLDGQQRLATLTILLAAIRDHLALFKDGTAMKMQLLYIGDEEEETPQYPITLNYYDGDYFRERIQRYKTTASPTPQVESHRLIDRAARWYADRLDERYDALNGGQKAFTWAQDLKSTVLHHVSLVGITSSDYDKAAFVFETLNDRGLGLSTPDLLRNLLMRRAHNQPEREQIVDCWSGVLDVDGSKGSVDSFLRHFWTSRFGDPKSRGLYRTIKNWIESANDPLTESVAFSRQLESSASVYQDILEARDPDPTVRQLLEAVIDLSATALLPAILSTFEEVAPLDQRIAVLRALISLFVRHTVIGGLENSRLENIVYRAAKSLRAHKDAGQILSDLAAEAPDDRAFRDSLEAAIVTNTKRQRYLLTQIEAHLDTGEKDTAGPSRVHVEHIYPRKPQPGQKLEEHALWLDRLGNLTLWSGRRNCSNQNDPYAKKKSDYRDSHIVITRELGQRAGDTWGPPEIEARQKRMADVALQIWTFGGAAS